MLRVQDVATSEPEGYLYQAQMFAKVELPEPIKRRTWDYFRAESV